VAVHISDPRTGSEGLDELGPLWRELHRHHREVSDYEPLVEDFDASWASRLRFYRQLLASGASYLTATDDDGLLVGYSMVALDKGSDDTFEVQGGRAEVVTLVVSPDRRSGGVGRALIAAAESIARDNGFDTVKIAVMSGNDRALEFYEANGYSVAEHVLYRRLEPPLDQHGPSG
jgi:ribosomal protein S18 acetylase RimI-like enzyme